jgi:hypothetical protein
VTADLASRKARAEVETRRLGNAPTPWLARALSLQRCDGVHMANRAKRPSKAWPAPLNKRQEPELPAWDLGPVPPPDNLTAFHEWGCKAQAYYAECDRITTTDQARMMVVLLEHMGVAPGDYKAATLWFAERYVPAFMKAGDRGGKPDSKSKLNLLVPVDRAKREGGAQNDTEALLKIYPKMNALELDNKRKRLAEARSWQKESKERTRSFIQKSFPGK